MYFDQNFKISIGLENGLALFKHQGIIRTKFDKVHWRIYASSSLNEQ